MPIIVKTDHPAKRELIEENVFVMDAFTAYQQQIRPLKVLLLNLMPNKADTERQFVRLLGNSPLQVELDFIAPVTHEHKNTPASHFEKHYTSFEAIKDNFYDAMIVTGAPVEKMDFEKVDYFEELQEIFDYSKTNVTSTMFICWASQAALYHFYGINKFPLNDKLFGLFPHYRRSLDPLVRGFDDISYLPHSRHTYVKKEDIEAIPELDILVESDMAGVNISATKNRRQIFVSGHLEYELNTLGDEYFRDIRKGLKITVPFNYFPDDDSTKPPVHKWRSHAFLFFNNWLNYYVYQPTPFDLEDLKENKLTDNSPL